MQLLVSLKAYREKFVEEQFCTTDDIFALVKSGSFSYEVEGVKHIISANEGALFQANVLGKKYVLEPVTMYLFRYRNATPLFHHKKIVFEDIGRIRSTLRLLDQVDTNAGLDAFNYRLSLFNDIVTQYRLQNYSMATQQDLLIARAEKIMQDNFHHKLDLKQIAQRCNLSYPQFIRRFKNALHLTPSDYVTTLRMNKAKTLLLTTDLQICEIAYSCGFESEYYFSKFFKSYTGIAPSMFRKTTV